MSSPSGDVEIDAALEAMLPSGAASAIWPVPAVGRDPFAMLGATERAAVVRAVPGRREEFARGRACARAALAAAGWTGGFVEIPVGPSREPLWPEGFVGSITHCEGLVAAVVARGLGGIGLDAEPATRPLPADVRDQVLTPSELERTAHAMGPEGETLHFCAKEAIHKAIFPRSGVWLDFLDVELRWDPGGSAFRASASPGAVTSTPEVAEIRGAWARADGFWIVVAYLPGDSRS